MACKYCLLMPAFLVFIIHYIVMHPAIRPYFYKVWPYCQQISASIRSLIVKSA